MSEATRLSYLSEYQSARASITYWKRQVLRGREDAVEALKGWEKILDQLRKKHKIAPRAKVISSRVIRPRWVAPKGVIKEVTPSVWIPSPLRWD